MRDVAEDVQNRGDLKERVRNFWNSNPCGDKYSDFPIGTKEYFVEIESHRYRTYPFHGKVSEFGEHRGEKVLEIGCGMGTDISQFAQNGAIVTGIDLTFEGVRLAKRRFEVFGLAGSFCVADAENLPFPDGEFDLVYSIGVLHHTPDTQKSVDEIYRVLKPGGKAIVMLYYEKSLLVRWYILFLNGVVNGRLLYLSRDELIARMTDGRGNPLSKCYTKREARKLFGKFSEVEFEVYNMGLFPPLDRFPRSLREFYGRTLGANLYIKARK
ncbi:MAG: class I SAM-dependent methyltransferase [bacterium]